MAKIEDSDSDSAQRAAARSWKLGVVVIVINLVAGGFFFIIEDALKRNSIPPSAALILAVLLIGLGLVVIGCMLVGFFSAVYALICMSSAGTSRILIPGGVGLVLNGLLATFSILSGIRHYRESPQGQRPPEPELPKVVYAAQPAPRLPSNTHLGTWEFQLGNERKLTCTFSANEFTFVNEAGAKVSFPYEIDYSMNPVWCTIHGEKQNKGSMLLMLDLRTAGKMKLMGGNTDPSQRFVDFGAAGMETILFTKLPDSPTNRAPESVP
jgi:hypothetical protein